MSAIICPVKGDVLRAVEIAYKGSVEKLLQLLTDIEVATPAQRGAWFLLCVCHIWVVLQKQVKDKQAVSI